MIDKPRESGLTLIQELEIENSPEFHVLAVNKRPPDIVMLWLVKMLSIKMDNLSVPLIHNFIVIKLWSNGQL